METPPSRRKRRIVWLALACVAAGALAWSLLRPAQGGAVGLPAFTLDRLEGGSVDLGAATGRPLVVNLWATWCPPCRRELPMLAAAARSEPGVTFYLVDQGESRDEVLAYLAERPELSAGPVLLDGTSQLSNHFEAMGLPVTLFFDAKGNHVLTHVGEVSDVELVNYLTDLKRGTL